MNTLYPIFLKTEGLTILIIGGGKVATEKFTYLLRSSPGIHVKIIARDFTNSLQEAGRDGRAVLCERDFVETDLEEVHFVFVTTGDAETNLHISRLAKAKGILLNVADSPGMCDFYLGGVVTKGELKVAISTNGKSPMLTKRLRQFFEAVLPDRLEELVSSLHHYRASLQGDLHKKVARLHTLTESLIKERHKK